MAILRHLHSRRFLPSSSFTGEPSKRVPPIRVTAMMNMHRSTRPIPLHRKLKHGIRVLSVLLVCCISLGISVSLSVSQNAPPKDSQGFITFCINVHDFFHVEESADILLLLIDLFESHGVRGDFYLTAPITHFYTDERPDVIARLRDSDMTISYHIRPPHPAYGGFDAKLRALSPIDVEALLRNYEAFRLDLATGEYVEDESGGITYLTEVFGRPPVCVSVPSERWRPTLLPIWYDMGAHMTVIYHESGTDVEHPFEWRDDLLIRPSDFSITRWLNPENGNDAFWWNMISSSLADSYQPVSQLQQQLGAWTVARKPFITVLIHENNFFRKSATPWANVFYADAQKGTPRTAPFDLNAPDASRPRTDEDKDAIWEAYAALVAYAAEFLTVVTSEDIVQLALATSK